MYRIGTEVLLVSTSPGFWAPRGSIGIIDFIHTVYTVNDEEQRYDIKIISMPLGTPSINLGRMNEILYSIPHYQIIPTKNNTIRKSYRTWVNQNLPLMQQKS